MHQFYHSGLLIDNPSLGAEEYKHAFKVLRFKAGTEFAIVNGRGLRVIAEVVQFDGKNAILRTKSWSEEPQQVPKIHAVIAPTKNTDRIEWFIEKAVEIGVDEISLIECDHSERSRIKADRLERIIVSAMNQSQRSWIPTINPICGLAHFLQTVKGPVLIAHCAEGPKQFIPQVYTPGSDICFMIGPEGDFSNKEIYMASSQGATPISLGPSRLRTETAALYALMQLHSLNLL